MKDHLKRIKKESSHFIREEIYKMLGDLMPQMVKKKSDNYQSDSGFTVNKVREKHFLNYECHEKLALNKKKYGK